MIIPFFPPMGGGGVHRPLSFVRYLPQHGWKTTVVTPEAGAYWISDPTLTERIPAACRVIRTRTLSGQSLLTRAGSPGRTRSQTRSSFGFGVARRAASAVLMPDSYVGWYPFALQAALAAAKAERFDVLYSTSPPETAHLVGLAVQRRTGLPWLADFRDPWMNLHLLPPPTGLHARLHRSWEARVCTTAHVVTTTRWHEARVRAGYPDAHVARISNGYDGDEARSVASITPASRPFRIVHAGTLTQRRTAVPFLEGLAAFLATRPDARDEIHVEFLGPREDDNERAVARLGLRASVSFRDTVPHAETLRVERSAHVLLLIKHADPRYDGLVPGKLYEYIGLRRPVLALVPPGEARDLVTGLRRGLTANPTATDEIARAIGELFDRHRGGTLESECDLSERPELERSRLAGDLAAAFDELCGRRVRA
jgi:glycosyltransferase involved in cell wall biosynthesis